MKGLLGRFVRGPLHYPLSTVNMAVIVGAFSGTHTYTVGEFCAFLLLECCFSLPDDAGCSQGFSPGGFEVWPAPIKPSWRLILQGWMCQRITNTLKVFLFALFMAFLSAAVLTQLTQMGKMAVRVREMGGNGRTFHAQLSGAVKLRQTPGLTTSG